MNVEYGLNFRRMEAERAQLLAELVKEGYTPTDAELAELKRAARIRPIAEKFAAQIVNRTPKAPPPRAKFMEIVKMMLSPKYRTKLREAAADVKKEVDDEEERKSARLSDARPRRSSSARPRRNTMF